jgi:ubiquinone/menaquinone biosynthesis C-methylase UbiE
MASRTTNTKSGLVEAYLARPEVHERWVRDYITPENDRFFEDAFDRIAGILDAPAWSTILDAGCGTCEHSIRLARRRFRVRAIDFSESALSLARDMVATAGLETQIEITRDNLLALSFPDNTFAYALCWGVLMHIPDIRTALKELARVLKPDGALIISEGNMRSWQSVLRQTAKKLFGVEKAEVVTTSDGLEQWSTHTGGRLLTREANIAGLIARCADLGLTLQIRTAGQLTEAYTRVSRQTPKNLIHGINRTWFHHIQWPGPAFGNILIFRKTR